VAEDVTTTVEPLEPIRKGEPAAARRRSSARPPVYRLHQYRTVIIFTVAVGLYVPLLVHSRLEQSLVNFWLLYSIMTVGFYLVFGMAGQFAFSQAFMVGLGAYTSGYIGATQPFWVAFIVAVAFSAGVAATFGLLVRKSSHFYFAVATLGLSEIGILVFNQATHFSGVGGQRLNIPSPSLFGYSFDTEMKFFFLALGVLFLALLLTSAVERSPVRREAVAVRDKELVSSTLGLPILKYKIVMYAIGSGIAAAAGSLYAHWQGVISPDVFNVDLGIAIFLMLILGGADSKWGAVLGAAFYTWVPDYLHSVAKYKEIVYGGLLVIVIIALPEGLIGVLDLVRRRLGRPRVGPGQQVWKHGVVRQMFRRLWRND
jgi:branched-chain amino acid transport system permease protein